MELISKHLFRPLEDFLGRAVIEKNTCVPTKNLMSSDFRVPMLSRVFRIGCFLVVYKVTV